MSESFHFESVDLFTVGTLGPLGQRVFYMQCRAEGRLVSLKFEKHQAAALAEYLNKVLGQLPPVHTDGVPSDLDLREPVIEAWTIGAMGIAYDEIADRVMLLMEEAAFEDDDPSDDDLIGVSHGASARFSLTRTQVKALITRVRSVVAAGRPPCLYCQRPLESYNDGWCACHN